MISRPDWDLPVVYTPALPEVDEAPPEAEIIPLDRAAVEGDLGPKGPISRSLPLYEDRESQREMAGAVADLYNDGGIGLLEAGTGVGKSLAYLIPALRWAAANGERTVVSTNTINLQEQLVRKDLPFLAAALSGEQEVRFVLLKGWRNYVCLLRLAQSKLLASTLLADDSKSELETIADWADRTTDGSLADLPSPPRPEVWDEIAAEPDLCRKSACPHYARCFLFQARRAAQDADVVVVNHHLLMSDVAVKRAKQNWEDAAVIPAYTRLVLDEAHHVEDAAAAHLGTSASRRGLQQLFSRLARQGAGNRGGRGLLHALEMRLLAASDLLSTASLDIIRKSLVPSVDAAREKASFLFDLLQAYLQQNGETVRRLTGDFSRDPVWKAGLTVALTDLLGEIKILRDGLNMIRIRMEGAKKPDETVMPLISEMMAVGRRLEGAAFALEGALRPPPQGEPMIRWIELRGREGNVGVSAVPLDLAPILREDLFSRVETAILTSATLTTDQRFDFLSQRLGLDSMGANLVTEIFPSPFEYPTHALFMVPTDAPPPNIDPAAHMQAVVRCIIDVTAASDGGVFALFTSHRDVRAAASELRARGVERSRPLYVHGEDTRDNLLGRFRDSERAVLLGTASFWEGVDVPGRALRGLIIARLPFRVPSEPVTAAHCEAIVDRGGDAFAEYMVPHAALRLKQGFGRLIRTATDRGVVVLVDPRAVNKGYGRSLLRDLPPARRVFGPWNTIVKQLQSFYA
ncbi:MAG TPA: ATP-dependent DNA helicase [Gemmatimonadaceae bacterium]|nr:ATP-dependent DNA helicase [Gemmatimonadaceae bacterium]